MIRLARHIHLPSYSRCHELHFRAIFRPSPFSEIVFFRRLTSQSVIGGNYLTTWVCAVEIGAKWANSGNLD